MSKFMVKISLLFTVLFFVCSSASVCAQTTNEEWENIVSQANETAVYNNGKIVSLKQTIPVPGTNYLHSRIAKMESLLR